MGIFLLFVYRPKFNDTPVGAQCHALHFKYLLEWIKGDLFFCFVSMSINIGYYLSILSVSFGAVVQT